MPIFQEHKNTFTKGLNVDFDPNILEPEQYIDAANVTLVPSGKFMALQNIAGTTNLQSLGITGTVMGVFATRYTIGTNTNLPCLTIFTAVTAGNINIWCYEPTGVTGVFLYKLYETPTPTNYISTSGGMVDGVLYPEKGMDILYFTDNFSEIRKIRCNIQAPNIAANTPFLTDTNMAVARRRAIGQVNFVSTGSGGTLLTGTYQLAYQLINLNSGQDTDYNKYTRFSLLTNPIHVYYNPTTAFGGNVGNFTGVGMQSDQLINVTITPTADELAAYTHFRLAIIENVAPEGTIALTAAVTEIQPIASYLAGGIITGYSIKNNYQNNSITLDDIVIDTAAVDFVKTLNIKNNVLFAGNINYKNLTYNNGTPAITSGSILQQNAVGLGGVTLNPFNIADFSTKYRGYFREEVYRFAIAYFDKYGNFSSPLPLDMSSVTDNQFSAVHNVFSNSNFTNGLTGWIQTAKGGVTTLGTITGGSGYVNAVYPGVVMTYVSGTIPVNLPTATITVAGGAVTSVVFTEFGSGLDNTTVLSATAASLGGAGSGFSVPVATTTASTSWTDPTNLYALASVTATVPGTNVLYQPVTITPGSYTFTMTYTTTAVSQFYVIKAVFFNSSAAVISSTSILASNFLGTNTFSTGITVPSGTIYMGFNVYYDSSTAGTDTIQVSSVTVLANSSFKDMKFPGRNQKLSGITYGLFGTGGTGIYSLGLQLNGIDHHPTWAQGFIILRAPRIKNILFQTPLVPMSNIYGLGPIDNYPVIAQEGVTPANVVYNSGTSTAGATGLQASPAGPVNVLYPMNLAWPKKRSINKVVADSGAGLNAIRAGEAQLVNDPPLTHAQIFPQGNLYTKNHPYIFSQSHRVKTIDAVIIRTNSVSTFGTNANGAVSWTNGSGDTSCTTSFVGAIDGDYYYDSGNSGVKTALRSNVNTFAAYAAFDNGSPGTVLNGKFAMTVDNLETKGVQFGWKPLIQKCSVAELTSAVTSINDNNALTFASGTPVAKVTNPSTDFFGTAQLINTIEIVNVLAGLNDARYGSSLTLTNFMFTGVQYNFTTSELITVAAGTSLPKNVTVYAGDCYTGSFSFKVSDTVYSVVNQEKYAAVPAGITSTVAISKWGRDWLNFTGPAVISLPVALRNASQYLTVILESEYNGGTPDFDTADIATATFDFPVYYAGSEYKCRSPLVYAYNYNENKQNDQKLFVPIDPLNPVLTTLKARIVYTNTKVYNTPTDGFDTIPVLNFYDLPETYGSLTKLSIEGNNMYSIQQRGIAYIPIGQRVIETSDASNLQVRSGDIINTPVWIDIKRGSQHLRSVKETGKHIYMIDNENQALYKLADQNLEHISDKGLMSTARSIFASQATENSYLTTYDILRNELWFSAVAGNFCYIWNENLNCWVSKYDFAAQNLGGSVFLNNKLYLVGQGVDNNNMSIHTMYTGNAGQLMGTYTVPSVTFIVNPKSDFGKTFDDILINSTDRLAQIVTTVLREASLGVQTATTLSLNVTTRGEGNYRAKILRDVSSGARLRGNKANHVLTWNSGGGFLTPVTVTSAITQWRPSFKQY